MLSFLVSFAVMLGYSIMVVVLQTTICLGGMYLINRFWEETQFGEFSFEPLDRAALQTLILKLLAIFAVATLPIHFLYFLLTYPSIYLVISGSTGFALLILLIQAVVPFVALWRLLELAPPKAAALAALNLAYYTFAFYYLAVSESVSHFRF